MPVHSGTMATSAHDWKYDPETGDRLSAAAWLDESFMALDSVAAKEHHALQLVLDTLQLEGLEVGGDAERAREQVEQRRLLNPDDVRLTIPATGDLASMVGGFIGNSILLALTRTSSGRAALHRLNQQKYVRFDLQRELKWQGKFSGPEVKQIGRSLAAALDTIEAEVASRRVPARLRDALRTAEALCGGHPEPRYGKTSKEWNHLARGLVEGLEPMLRGEAPATTIALAPKYLRSLNAVRSSFGQTRFAFPEGTLSPENEFAGDPVRFSLGAGDAFSVDAPEPRTETVTGDLDQADQLPTDGRANTQVPGLDGRQGPRRARRVSLPAAPPSDQGSGRTAGGISATPSPTTPDSPAAPSDQARRARTFRGQRGGAGGPTSLS